MFPDLPHFLFSVALLAQTIWGRPSNKDVLYPTLLFGRSVHCCSSGGGRGEGSVWRRGADGENAEECHWEAAGQSEDVSFVFVQL